MKHEPQSRDQRAAEALERVHDIKAAFRSIRDLLNVQIESLGAPDAQSPKPLLAKLAELQTAQVQIARAEEAFYEKYDSDATDDAAAYDEIRAEIGRALDRIRRAEQAGSVSAGTQ